jgi:hypothetical protein
MIRKGIRTGIPELESATTTGGDGNGKQVAEKRKDRI